VLAVLVVALTAGCGADGGETGGATTVSATSPAATASGSVPGGVAAQYATVNEEIEAEGGRLRSGDWEIAYIVEPAEPWFETSTGEPVKREPAAGETHHIEIIPFEAATGRIVPEVPIRLEVLDSTGAAVDAKDLQFFSAEFFHYANNFSVPEAGEYTLRASLQPPQYNRHGESLDELTLLEPVTATFEGVRLDPSE